MNCLRSLFLRFIALCFTVSLSVPLSTAASKDSAAENDNPAQAKESKANPKERKPKESQASRKPKTKSAKSKSTKSKSAKSKSSNDNARKKSKAFKHNSPVEQKLKRNEYGLHFVFRPNPEERMVHVEVHLNHDRHLSSVSFRHDSERQLNFRANGKIKRYKSSIKWTPKRSKDVLRYDVKVRHKRDDQGYDAYIGNDWAIFRGEDLVPGSKVKSRKDSYSHTTFEIVLPPRWTGMDSGWPRGRGKYFRVDNPERMFDRPTGWMIAGKIGSRRDYLDSTQISIAAPQGEAMQRMNALALINLVWPQIQLVFKQLPEKVLVVGADDPMWRGGLSSPNSFFVHTDRPLVSENGTSTLLHELVHVLSRIRGGSQSDWIPEGLAEFYSIELMHRAGAMNDDRHEKVLQNLERWSVNVDSLKGPRSTGRTTARAVLLLHQLDREIREASQGEKSIDDLTRALIKKRRITNKRFRSITEDILGRPSRTLDSRLLK